MKTISIILLCALAQLSAQTIENRNINNVGLKQTAASTAAWTSATSVDTAVTLAIGNYGLVVVSFNVSGGSISAGTINFEIADDGTPTKFYTAACVRSSSLAAETTYSLTSADQLWQCNVSGATHFRVRLNPAITGAGTANIRVQASSGASFPQVVVAGTVTAAQSTAANLKVDPSGVTSPVNVSQINGVTPLMGNGATGTGSHRVTLANDSSAIAGKGEGAAGSAVPSGALYMGANSTGNLTGLVACDNRVVYDASTSGNTELVALTSSQIIRVCGYVIFSAGTVNVRLVYGTGTACATGETSVTPAFQLTAQTGVADNSPFYRGMATAASNALCIETSAGVAVQAVVYYTKY